MKDSDSCVVLIGMPGAGKSTLGVLLAKELGMSFLDTDILIQEKTGTTLQAYMDEYGYLALRKVEEEILLELECKGHVISTGGSVVYSESGMNALKKLGRCVYLEISLETMLSRVNNQGSRGIASPGGKTLADVYEERLPLYAKYADITIDCNGKIHEKLVENICLNVK